MTSGKYEITQIAPVTPRVLKEDRLDALHHALLEYEPNRIKWSAYAQH